MEPNPLPLFTASQQQKLRQSWRDTANFNDHSHTVLAIFSFYHNYQIQTKESEKCIS
jgi:hypothetical protein